MDFPDFKLFDVMCFLAVSRRGTVTGAARELTVVPSQVSKSIARLERQFRTKLVARTGRGMVITPDGASLLVQLEEVVAKIQAVYGKASSPGRQLALAAPSSMIDVLVPAIAARLTGVQLRVLEMSCQAIDYRSVEKVFDVALTTATFAPPKPWVSTPVGELRLGLLARPELASELGPQPLTVEEIRTVPFITPLPVEKGLALPAEDHCPLPSSERRRGHQAESIRLALRLAARTDQVVFCPILAATEELASGRLVELRVQGWDVRHPLSLLCNADTVKAAELKAITGAIRDALELPRRMASLPLRRERAREDAATLN